MCPFKSNLVQQSLEKCIQLSISTLPELNGYTVCLCDNSGSAWGTFQSEFGSQTVATIGNLSGLLTAFRSTKGGCVGVFGDQLETIEVNTQEPILEQLEKINETGKKVGQSTENGIWLWFEEAYQNCSKEVDHLFIYSDMQAGHGGLYGINKEDYQEFCFHSTDFFDLFKLVERHRKNVHPHLNIFSVQTAGYDNTVLPEVSRRSALLSGWTGKEIVYASRIISIWETVDPMG